MLKGLKSFSRRLDYKQDDTPASRMIAKVAGVTFENRQDLIARMEADTPIRLERDRRNGFDFYAVKVMATLPDQEVHVGFLPKNMAKKVARRLDTGTEYKARVNKIIGGPSLSNEDGEPLNYGLELLIER